LDDLLNDLLRLVRVLRVVGYLRARDLALLVEHFARNLLARDVARLRSRDVHRDVFDELLELVCARDAVCLAVDLDEHADLATHVYVGADRALCGDSSRLLRGRRHAALAKDFDGLLLVALGLLKCLLALHHPRARLLPERLHSARCYFRHVLKISSKEMMNAE